MLCVIFLFCCYCCSLSFCSYFSFIRSTTRLISVSSKRHIFFLFFFWWAMKLWVKKYVFFCILQKNGSSNKLMKRYNSSFFAEFYIDEVNAHSKNCPSIQFHTIFWMQSHSMEKWTSMQFLWTKWWKKKIIKCWKYMNKLSGKSVPNHKSIIQFICSWNLKFLFEISFNHFLPLSFSPSLYLTSSFP